MRLKTVGVIISSAIATPLEFNDSKEIETTALLLEADSAFAYIRLKNLRNEIIYERGDLSVAVKKSDAGEVVKENGQFHFVSPVETSKGEKVGEIAIGMNLERIQQVSRYYRKISLFVGCLMVLMGYLVVLLIKTGVLKPLLLRVQETGDELLKTTSNLEKSSLLLNDGAQEQAFATDEARAAMEEMSVSIQAVAKNAVSFSDQVHNVSASVEQIGVMSEKVAESSNVMAADVLETSTTIEEMVTSIGRINEALSNAHGLSKQASSEAKIGRDAIEKTVTGMKSVCNDIEKISHSIETLGKRSEAIGNIVEIIDNIADQTNLLALNASIEAARAGKAGQGFSVVAEEIRDLAERSVKATKEISDVIKDVQRGTVDAVKLSQESNTSARRGIDLADTASTTFEKISTVVDSTSEIMTLVSNATSEQASGVKNVVSSVEKMRQLTTSVDESIKEQAKGVSGVVDTMVDMVKTTEEIKAATQEQLETSKHVIDSSENIRKIAKSNVVISDDLSGAVSATNESLVRLKSVLKWLRF